MQKVASVDEVLEFWFADALASAEALERQRRIWFMSGTAIDETIAERFGATLQAAAGGELESWSGWSRGRLALILVLDQFPRNIHRGSARAFEFDTLALAQCLEGIELGQDRELGTIERCFFYMPLQHAEDRRSQALAVERFSALVEECAPEHEAFHRLSAEHARQHREIVERFGRYPHRNRILSRPSTDEEQEYLAGDAPRFGQK